MTQELPAPYGLPFEFADALLTPLLRGAGRLAVAAARAVRRACRVRAETREASLLGIPSPAAVRAVWTPPRRSLRQALLIGSKLADLTPSHPSEPRRAAPDARGRQRFAGRAGGLKRYFSDVLPDLPYPTAMRYRRLALRLLRVLGTPAAIPLEWLLSDPPADTLVDDAGLLVALRDGRRRLAEMLTDIHSQRELSRWLDCQADPAALSDADLLRESVAHDELLRRGVAKLEVAVAAGRRLAPAERRAWNLLVRFRLLASLCGRRQDGRRTGSMARTIEKVRRKTDSPLGP